MKKIKGTKVKRYMAGPAPSIDDVTYSTTPFSVAATSSSGLAVSYGVAGPAIVDSDGQLTMIGKGSVTVFFFQDGNLGSNADPSDDYYLAAPRVVSFTVNGASATVTLADAAVTYTGTGQFLTPAQTDSASATLNEPITVTYADAAGADVASPTNVGVYSVTATITSASNYSGSDTATLTITKAAATVTISGISQTHDGSQKPVTVVTVPAGLSVTTTYTGGSFAPAAAIAAVEAVEAAAEVLYVEGDTIPEGKAVGEVKTAAVTAVTAVAAVAAVIAPSGAGDYAVSVTVVDDNYSGSSSATLTIGSVIIDNTAVTYTGAAQAPSVTLVPSDLTHTVTYADSAGAAVASPTNADTYTVLVTVSDARYPGDASASYTINPAALTADLGDLTISYGFGVPSSADWAATLSYAGFVGGESATTEVVPAVAATYEDDGVTIKTPAVAAVPAVVTTGLAVSYDKAVSDGGAYVATPAGLSSSNYAFTYTAGSLAVTKLSATVTVTNTTQGYTGSVLGVTATPSIEGLTVNLVYRDSAAAVVDSPTAQGTYYVTATIDDPNYAGEKQETLTITKATTTLELDDLADVVYTETPITLQSTVTGDRPVLYFVTGAATASGNVITLKSAGSVRVTAYVAGTDDYQSAYVAKTFTVSKAPTSVFMADADVIYNGLGQALSATVTDESGTTLTVDVDVVYKDASGNTVASPTDTGVYTVTATVNDTRYSGSTTGTLTILPTPLTITADNQTKEYLEANPALTLTYAGFQNSEDSSVLTTQATFGTAADENSGLGTYGIVVYGAVAANYTITHVDGTLTVEKNSIVITLTGTSQTYTGSGLAVTATPAVADITVVVTYADSADAAVASPTNAGTYTVTATVDDVLYRGTQSGTLTIGKATAEVTLGSLAHTYDGTEKVASATTTPSGLTVDLTYSQGATLVAPIAAVAAVDAVAKVLYVTGDTLPDGKVVGDVKTAAVAAVTAVAGVTGPSNAGTYSIVGSVNDDNYQGFATVDLVIAKKALSATADALTKTYGSANPAATITYSGFENSEDATVLDTAPVATMGTDETSGVGEYDIALSAGTDNNYEITNVASVAAAAAAYYVAGDVLPEGKAVGDEKTAAVAPVGKLTVTKAVVAVTADDAAKIYGFAVAAIGFTSTGYVNGEDVNDIDTQPVVTTTATAASDVGAYVTTASGGVDDNYSFAYTDGVLTISKAAATIALSDNTASYDGKSHGVTVTTTPAGLEGSVTVTYVDTTNKPVFVGVYTPVTASMDDKNYSAVDVIATFTIEQGAATYVTLAELDDAFYGDPPLDLGLRSSTGGRVMVFISGPAEVANDEGRLVTITDVGIVDILLYAFGPGIPTDYRFQAASFEVKKRPMLITADNKSRAYGSDNPALTYTIQGFAPGEDESVFSTAPALTTTAASATGIGDVAITFATEAVDGTGHYAISHQPGTLTVSEAPLTITAVDQSRTYGDDNPDSPTPPQGLRVREYRGISGTQVSDLTESAEYRLLGAAASTVKYIETEDFNYDGGSYKTFEDVGTGGSYDGLGAVSGIDFNNSGNSSAKYRVIPDNHPGMTESMWDAARNGFDMTVDFKMGWNDDGDWYNYTRDFEAGSYAVFGRFSSGGAAINNKLSIVTSDATAADQTLEDVGTFTGPATGGWNNMAFFPLKDADGKLAKVTLSGTSTVRLTKLGGNMDANYMAFVPYDRVPDGYDFQGVAGYFEWPQSGDINTKPAGNVRDNYGVVMDGYITPTETAAYQFYLAADDHAELWLSTDSDPANLVKIANEPQWNGVRSFAGTDRRAKADVDTITLTAPSALDVATTAGGIAAAINAGSSDTSAKVTATSSAGVVTITAAEANNVISIASEVTNGGTDDTQSGVLATTTAAAAAVDAVAEVLYVTGDTLPDGKVVGDVKTAAVAAVAAKAQVVTYTVSGVIEAGDSVKLTITGSRLETTSLPIALTAGTSYYVRALMKEGGGGDNVAVTWIKSGEAAPANS